MDCRRLTVLTLAPVAALAVSRADLPAQTPSEPTDYIIGFEDLLATASYDQAVLSGKFTVETDGTLTFRCWAASQRAA
jgi:hypothetical protein